MTSVERILQYSKLDQEAPANREDVEIPPGWPNEGAITFDNTSLSYSEDSDLALKDVSVSIKSCQKVGSSFVFWEAHLRRCGFFTLKSTTLWVVCV